jgi:adenylate cyclase
LSAVLSRSKGTQADEESFARQAVSLDGRNAEARARLALALLARGDHSAAAAEAQRSLALCPNLAAANGALGVVQAYSGQPHEGLVALQACVRLDPRGPFLVNRLNQVALAHYFCGDYASAAQAAQRAIESFPEFPSPHRWLAAALGQLGRKPEAMQALESAIRISASQFDFQVRQRPPWFRPQEHALMLDGLAKAGL